MKSLKTLAVMSAVMFSSSLWAAIVGPYTADANTLHLYHLDATSAPLVDTGNGVVRNLANVDVGATLGVTGYFNNAVSFGTSSSANASVFTDLSNSSPQSQWQGVDGAFTYEALVRPASIIGDNDEMQILCRQDTNRAFQFRILSGQLQFINSSQVSAESFSVNIPTTGDQAFSANEWYHVAVTYNGQENTAGNIKMYWTKMDAANEVANLIYSGTMVQDVLATGGDIRTFVGNRTGQNENFFGYIDELRVSNVALTDSQFLFVPEPATLSLLAIGVLGLVRRKK